MNLFVQATLKFNDLSSLLINEALLLVVDNPQRVADLAGDLFSLEVGDEEALGRGLGVGAEVKTLFAATQIVLAHGVDAADAGVLSDAEPFMQTLDSH